MSLQRILLVLRKDLQLGPRSPIFLWVLALPLLITLVLQVTFGDLFDPDPRMGIVDRGSSTVTTSRAIVNAAESDGAPSATYPAPRAASSSRVTARSCSKASGAGT